MLLRIDPAAAAPLFEQLVQGVKEAVAAGQLATGDKLPSVRELARELASAGELWNVYGLRTITVPTRRPCRRAATGLRVFPTADAKWQAVVDRIREIHDAGRPVLVGTCSVEASEAVSARLRAASCWAPCSATKRSASAAWS